MWFGIYKEYICCMINGRYTGLSQSKSIGKYLYLIDGMDFLFQISRNSHPNELGLVFTTPKVEALQFRSLRDRSD